VLACSFELLMHPNLELEQREMIDYFGAAAEACESSKAPGACEGMFVGHCCCLPIRGCH
jgi:hypothetical protein